MKREIKVELKQESMMEVQQNYLNAKLQSHVGHKIQALGEESKWTIKCLTCGKVILREGELI